MNILTGPAFAKSVDGIHVNHKKKINEIVPFIQENYPAGRLLNGKKLGGIRHYKIDQNFSLYYVYCKEAHRKRDGRACKWCNSIECSKIHDKANTIMLLFFGDHDISDNN